MNELQEKQFEELSEQYVNVLHLINNFIAKNNLDYNDTWDKANQRYDEDCTYASD